MPDTLFLTDALLAKLHVRRGALGLDLSRELGLYLEIPVYFKDPVLAADLDRHGLNDRFEAAWEPGLADGPVSSRFYVQPVDGSSARWDAAQRCFLNAQGTRITQDDIASSQYRQVATWAVLQNTLEHVQDAFGIGRRIDWNFDGPLHVTFESALDGNAWYKPAERALVFASYPANGVTVHTCLGSDIVNHELGHAILDAVRPRYLASDLALLEPLAFHESFGDILALLFAIRDNSFRKFVGALTEGDLTDNLVSDIARQFGQTAAARQPHLRSGVSTLTMADMPGKRFHDASQILTAAVFGYLVRLAALHRDTSGNSVAEALWRALRRVQATFLQSVDLLPPILPAFADLGAAMLRMTTIYDPTDAKGYGQILREEFQKRGIILPPDEVPKLSLTPPDLETLCRAASPEPGERAAATEVARAWLDRNRDALEIPAGVALTVDPPAVADLHRHDSVPLARRIAIPYHWQEKVGTSGIFRSWPCGGTLVLDIYGRVLFWARKPGSETAAGQTRLRTLSAQPQFALDGNALCCGPGIDDGLGQAGAIP